TGDTVRKSEQDRSSTLRDSTPIAEPQAFSLFRDHVSQCVDRARSRIRETIAENGIKDGGFGRLLHDEPPLTAQQGRFGDEFGRIIWEEAQASGFVSTIKQVEGPPTAEQLPQLEATAGVAAEKARSRIARLLDPGCLERTGGNQIYTRLLGAMVDALQVPDKEFCE
ncbi:hypothetical protein FOL47_005661, partial [Perkinsus chesapeaki]